MADQPWISTFMHHELSFSNPLPEQISIIDIAHALSRVQRFGGHLQTPYTVAQHCIAMSKVVPENYAMAALLHDAPEAYIGDIVSPLKSMLRDIESIEDRLFWAIFEKLGEDFSLLNDRTVWDADRTMAVTEAKYLGGNPTWCRSLPAFSREVLTDHLQDPFKAYLDRYNELKCRVSYEYIPV